MEALSFNKRHIPNILTMFRILLIIPIIVIAMVDSFGSLYVINIDNFSFSISINMFIILILFIVASFTDWLDGYLSRKYNWVSDFGKILDPIADKVLVNVVFIILAINSQTHWVFIALFIFRDTVVDGIRMFAASEKVIIPANMLGKLKTVTQMAAIIILLIIGSNDPNIEAWWYWGVQNIFVYLAVISSLLSGYVYVSNFIKIKYSKCKDINV
ncbi:MAG: CDP-diacylglycerol--glycerol-3-phosphate 3-phosphatidyltransferase [Mycoplasma sp.]